MDTEDEHWHLNDLWNHSSYLHTTIQEANVPFTTWVCHCSGDEIPLVVNSLWEWNNSRTASRIYHEIWISEIERNYPVSQEDVAFSGSASRDGLRGIFRISSSGQTSSSGPQVWRMWVQLTIPQRKTRTRKHYNILSCWRIHWEKRRKRRNMLVWFRTCKVRNFYMEISLVSVSKNYPNKFYIYLESRRSD